MGVLATLMRDAGDKKGAAKLSLGNFANTCTHVLTYPKGPRTQIIGF